MKKQLVSLLMSSVLMLSIAAVVSADSAMVSANNVDYKSNKGNEMTVPYALKLKDILTWNLNGDTTDPVTSYSVTIGYPNIKLYAKNRGTQPFRVEVMHNSKKTVIFNTVSIQAMSNNNI